MLHSTPSTARRRFLPPLAEFETCLALHTCPLTALTTSLQYIPARQPYIPLSLHSQRCTFPCVPEATMASERQTIRHTKEDQCLWLTSLHAADVSDAIAWENNTQRFRRSSLCMSRIAGF